MPLWVIVLRLVVPIIMLRFPLAGGIVAIVADNLDWPFSQFHTFSDYGSYQRADKLLDMYYLSFMLYVSLFWKNSIARHTSIALFFYRAIGVFLFETTHIGLFLLLFPSLFEFFFLFYQGHLSFTKQYLTLTGKNLSAILFILLIPKLLQEYSANIVGMPPWGWETAPFLAIILGTMTLFILLLKLLAFDGKMRKHMGPAA